MKLLRNNKIIRPGSTSRSLFLKPPIRKMYMLGIVLFTWTIQNISARELLYVFYPSTTSSEAFQEAMSGVLPKTDITVFSRYDDFKAKLLTEPPDAIVTKTILIQKQLDHYKIELNGERNGSIDERYIFLSARGFTVDNVGSTTVIGMMDILGRVDMRDVLRHYFPSGPKLKRVATVGDLLSLLLLNVASGIVTEEIFVDYFTSSSQIKFTVAPLDGTPNGIVACAVKKGGSAIKTIEGLAKNDTAVCRLFYIDQWR